MFNKRHKKGSVILEVLIAIGLSAFFFSAIAGLMMASNKSMESLYSSQKAIWRAQEGLGALQSMSFDDLSTTENGLVTYSNVSDAWSLGSGTENFDDGQSREIVISEVERDNACLIVEAGGTVDPDTYQLESTVYWTGSTGAVHNRSLQSLVVNWEDSQGECFRPTDAGGIDLDWSGGYWGGSKQLRGVWIINNTTRDITITKMTIWWDRPASKLQQIFAIGTKVWSDSGPGTPLGLQSSGVLIDTLDATIPAGFTDDTHKIQFTQAMEGSTLIISFEFADGSILITDPFTP
ncbi:hypothetical protein KJ673_03075 [Patescibacteria group bacterium]|nr:hypothetical protein [Patescibacteria group bacterium]MBU4452982.1 hypothetical protein [Patescibacteria group bacterium]MCG2687184.1 hypothetical protein [Candidatus Parcubacteria bacterium]